VARWLSECFEVVEMLGQLADAAVLRGQKPEMAAV
jgi:hypothetical protein